MQASELVSVSLSERMIEWLSDTYRIEHQHRGELGYQNTGTGSPCQNTHPGIQMMGDMKLKQEENNKA